jgi:Protein of unknown function (DUF1573)
MKKIVLLVAFALLGTTVTFAQDVAAAKTEIKKAVKVKKVKAAKVVAEVKKAALPQVEGAGMVFDNETIDYGTIQHNADGKREFTFTNNGNKPLIITNTQGSCGCTVPSTPKDPIAPGAKGSIGVKYATDRVGAFTKTVTVTSNAEGMPTKVITIKGTVLPDATPVAPATPAMPKS